MNLGILLLDLRLRRRTVIGTAIGTAVYLLLVVAVFPTFTHDTAFDDVIRSNPTAAAAFGINGSITSPEGWLGANMYSNFGPLLALLLTIGYGAATVAGQDADGTLGLLATLPVTRTRILIQKVMTLLTLAAVVPLVAYAVCLLGPRFELQPSWGPLVEASAALTLLAFDLGALALLVGAVTGSRGTALGVASATAAAAYLVSALAPAVPALRGVRWISPFTWAVGDNQLVHGLSVPELGALIAVGLVMVALCLPAMRRLDIH